MSQDILEVTAARPDGREHRVGVLDIGSNSVRLVVFAGDRRMPIPIFNEKALCGLGADLKETGRLSETGRISAIVNIARFIEIAREMELARLDILATAAVRDAENGPDFVRDLEHRFGLEIQVLPGDEEARLSALGVVSAFPGADGVVGDLGGGSLELVDIDGGEPCRYSTMPLGSLRFGELSERNGTAVSTEVDRHLRALSWLDRLNGRPLYAVGGAWRSLARLHMIDRDYPLHVVHGYNIAAESAVEYLDRLSGMSKKQLSSVAGLSRRRTSDITLSSLILSRVLRLGGASHLVFSAFGLREGCLFDRLPEADRSQDPLLASCMEIAGKSRRFPEAARAVEHWVKGFLPDQPARDARLLTAVSILSDLAWAEHPSYRGEHAFLQVLRLPVVGLNHEDRVFVALAILARYTGHMDRPVAESVSGLIAPERRDLALLIGRSLRLGLTLSGGMARLLGQTEVRTSADRICIAYPPEMAAVHGDAVGRRADDLAQILGKPVIVLPEIRAVEADVERAIA